MEAFIDSTLRKVLNDFTLQAAQVGKLCDCKTLTYQGGQCPDYNNPLIQQLYMFRYFPAYLVEYAMVYEHLLRKNFLNGELNLISLGCGCGVDLWGLYFALKDTGDDPASRVRYQGIDIIDWQYRNTLTLPRARITQQDMSKLPRLDRDDYNVFIFPKSIAELPPHVFESTCEMLRNSNFTHDRVVGMCSLMTEGLSGDSDRFARLATIMQESHGFKCLDDANAHWLMKKDQGLRAICSSFVYPDDIMAKVKNLLDECPTKMANRKPCRDDCASHLNRSPILRTTFIKYQLLRFERPTAQAPASPVQGNPL